MTINIFSNNAKTTLASGITSSQTSITVAPGDGSLFPSPILGVSTFKVTLVSAGDASIYEVCDCTARTGDVLTIVRGQEGTTGTPFLLSDIVGHFDTAGVMTDLLQSEQLQKGDYQVATATGTGDAITATLPSNLTAITDGFRVLLSATLPNTGAATLTLTLGSTILPTYAIVKGNNVPLVAGDIPSAGYQMNLSFSAAYNAYALLNPSIAISTAPQFDDSTAVATTAFVQRALGNYQTVIQYVSQTLTIPATNVGAVLSCSGVNVLTLPLASDVPIGAALIFNQQGSATAIYPNAGDILTAGDSGSVASIQLLNNDFVTIVKQITGVWVAISGTTITPMIGINQTWHDVKASRAFGTLYTNTSYRPIFVSVVVNCNASAHATSYCDGVIVGYTGAGPSQIEGTMSFIVPPGSTYEIINSGSTLSYWAELS